LLIDLSRTAGVNEENYPANWQGFFCQTSRTESQPGNTSPGQPFPVDGGGFCGGGQAHELP
jgi:hypothetical protein